MQTMQTPKRGEELTESFLNNLAEQIVRRIVGGYGIKVTPINQNIIIEAITTNGQ